MLPFWQQKATVCCRFGPKTRKKKQKKHVKIRILKYLFHFRASRRVLKAIKISVESWNLPLHFQQFLQQNVAILATKSNSLLFVAKMRIFTCSWASNGNKLLLFVAKMTTFCCKNLWKCKGRSQLSTQIFIDFRTLVVAQKFPIY